MTYTRYDAWDRQVGVATSGGAPIASYSFDGLNHRVTKTLANGATTDYYYNENGQVLEERARNSGGALTLTTQYVWDVSYIDTPVAQIQIVPESPAQTLYYTTDANHNVTGLVNLSGSVVERYIYSAYGQVTFCDGNWARLTTTPSGGNNGGVGLQNRRDVRRGLELRQSDTLLRLSIRPRDGRSRNELDRCHRQLSGPRPRVQPHARGVHRPRPDGVCRGR